jgi:hypothetical protein
LTDNFSEELKSLHAGDVIFRDEEFGIDVWMSVHELFTARACDELAVALAELIDGGDVVEIRTAGDWPGNLLLHAGVHRDDRVYDIEGAHEIDEWIERWGRGMDIEVRFSTFADEQHTFQNSKSRNFAEEIAAKLFEVPELGSARKSLLQP